MTSRESQIIRIISNRIKELDSTAEVILYGSHARGEASGDSDWDILVLLKDDCVTLREEQRFRHHLHEIELEIAEPISVYVKSKSQWESKFKITPLYQNIQKEGLKLS